MSVFQTIVSMKDRFLGGYDLYGREILASWISKYAVCKAPVVLDVGCGEGDDLSTVKRFFPESRLIGIDVPGISFDRPGRDYIESHTINLEASSLPFEDETFDLVISNQVFEHLKNWVWVVMEIARVLKPGGVVIVGVPNLASLHNRILLCLGRQPTCIRTYGMHIRGFSPEGISEVMGYADVFSLQAIAGAGFYPFPPFIAKRLAKIFPAAAVTIYMAYKKNGDYREFQNVEAIKRINELRISS